MLDYQELKKADASLGISDPGAAAEALNKQTQSVIRDFESANARGVLLGTGMFGRMVRLSRTILPMDAPYTQTMMVDACIEAVTVLNDTKTIEATNPEKWAKMQFALMALEALQLIDADTKEAVLGLATVIEPVWPKLDAGHIQTARAQP